MEYIDILMQSEMKIDYSKQVEVRGAYDVIVAGSGPERVCAPVAAAREGSKVALV